MLGKQTQAVCTVLGYAAQKVVVVPDAQLHLDRGDLGDAPCLLDLTDRHIAETDRVDQPVAFKLESARTLVESAYADLWREADKREGVPRQAPGVTESSE